jgi:hypothetical protein
MAWTVIVLLVAITVVGTLGLAHGSLAVVAAACGLAGVVLAYSRRWSMQLSRRAQQEFDADRFEPSDVSATSSASVREQRWIAVWCATNIAAAVGVYVGAPPAIFLLNLLVLAGVIYERRRRTRSKDAA